MRKKSVKFIKDHIKNVAPSTITVEFADSSFEVVQYLPVIDKLAIVDTMIDLSTVTTESGCLYIDETTLDIIGDYMLLEKYTNLNIGNSFTDVYDLAYKSGLMPVVYENIPDSELNFIHTQLQRQVNNFEKQLKYDNRLSNVVLNLINALNDNIPEIIEAVNGFDPDKLEFLNNNVDFINQVGEKHWVKEKE